MNVSDSALIALNSLAVAGLMVAGGTKLVAPRPVRRALDELLPGRALPVPAVRAFAGVEIAVALALTHPSTRVVAAFGLAALGLTFAVAGVAGRVRRSTVACGCLGGGERALGTPNVLAGLAFLGVAGVGVTAASTGTDVWNAAPLAGAAATVLLCAWTHRALMWRLLGPRPASITG